MKKLIAGFILLGSFSATAMNCGESIDLVSNSSKDLGRLEFALMYQSNELSHLRVIKEGFISNPDLNTLSGVSKNDIDTDITRKEDRINTLRVDISETRDGLKLIKDASKKLCE
ncbi:hypothetical protein [Halobacteriovorax sp. HLS]|uniref:hypothetical protein n=1 Tax=Halobacteriovorax sp. HLS TaxID=2234000 RepID=UPI000FD79FD1|nr:hypothetical protein [Halobacteriovorax sp. HLS]